MDPKVKEEYDRVLAIVAIRKGALMCPSGSRYYGWIGDDWQHLSRCGAKSWGVAKETQFTQFDGTFVEETRYHTAIDVSDVTCHCGRITSAEVRWEPSDGLSEVTTAIFEEMYNQLRAKNENDE